MPRPFYRTAPAEPRHGAAKSHLVRLFYSKVVQYAESIRTFVMRWVANMK